jgi:probable DNA repair protein
MNQRLQTALTEGATIVTAGRRLARTLSSQYDEEQPQRGAGTWAAPPIVSWSGWIHTLWEEYLYSGVTPPVRLSPWQERVLWERVIGETPASGELLQAAATAAAAQEAFQLMSAWRLDLAAVDAAGNEDARAFAAWADRVQRTCAERGWIVEAQVPDTLATAAAMLRLPRRMVLAGFDEFTPQQRALFEACRLAGCEAEVVRLGSQQPATAAVRVPFPDGAQELDAAARWARALLESGAGDIAVVVPDLAERRRDIERIFRSILEPASLLPGGDRQSRLVNFSAGDSLAAYPLVRAALDLLSLRPDRNDWQLASTLIRDSYIGGAETERTKRGLLDAALRKEGAAEVTLAQIRAPCGPHGCPLLDGVLRSWQRVHEKASGRQTPAAWSRTFSDLLQAAGWPGERGLDSAEYQAAHAWDKVLSEFAASGLGCGEIAFDDALSLLRRIAEETMFQPESAHAPVQVLGTLEAAGLRFDHLWVSGLHDEAWPGAPKPNPFLPLGLQRAAGLPRCSPERELTFAMLITDRLLASAADIVLSYPVRDGERDLAPSPLILRVSKATAADLALWQGEDYTSVVQRSREVERLVDETAPPLPEGARQRGGANVFKYQAACPFRAFAELRLDVEAMEKPESGLAPRERGTLVHGVLERVWREVKSQAALCERTDIPDVIRTAVAESVAALEAKRGAALPSRFAALERRRLENVIAEWLEIERQRPPFELVEQEGERLVELGGIPCKVKIDRIDRLPDGRDIIIDYKTGKATIGDWDSARPKEPQLPLYCATYPGTLAGVLFAQLRTGESRFLGWVDTGDAISGAKATDLAAQVEAWNTVLEKLASDFRAGHAEPDPKDPNQSCTYCHLPVLCRATGDEEQDEEGAE